MSEPSHAIVLSGGGANGAYEIGVMEALLSGRAPHAPRVDPSVFVGTSVGSFNAAAMVSLWREQWGWLPAVRRLREIWVDKIAVRNGRNGVFRPRFLEPQLTRDIPELMASWIPRAVDLFFTEDPPLRRALRLVDGQDAMSTAPLEKLIAETIDPTRVTQSATRLKIATCNWDTGKAVVFRNGEDPQGPRRSKTPAYDRDLLTEANLARVVLASTSIPAVFPRVQIDGSYFVDGGVVMNTPLVPALHAGATVIHVIHMEPRLLPLPIGQAPSAFESLERILAATPARLIENDIRQARLANELTGTAFGQERGWIPIEIHRYFPRRQIGGVIGLLNFDRARLCELIENGFRDAVEHDCHDNECVLPAQAASVRAEPMTLAIGAALPPNAVGA